MASHHLRFAPVSSGIQDLLSKATLFCLMSLLLIPLIIPSTASGRTRAECGKCCERKERDEYYREQCKLKCFRNPDHCVSSRRSAPAVSASPGPATKAPAKRRKKARRKQTVTLAFPKQIEITPGKEWEAAVQILQVNGIDRRHPKFQQALSEVTAVLVDFARGNPQGGRLNTKKLERILVRYK